MKLVSHHQKEVELLLFYGYIMGLLYQSGHYSDEMWNRKGHLKKSLWDQVRILNSRRVPY